MGVIRLPIHLLDFKTKLKEGGMFVTIIGALVTVLEAAVIVSAKVGEIRSTIVLNVVNVAIFGCSALVKCKAHLHIKIHLRSRALTTTICDYTPVDNRFIYHRTQ